MRVIIFLVSVLLPSFVFADAAGSIGEVADNLMVPVTILSDFICTASVIVGSSTLFASFFKYMQHRVNPLAVPLSTVLTLLFLGLALVCLPLVYKYTESGIPYSFLN